MIRNLDINPEFPDPLTALPDGLLAYGGSLSPERLINAYSKGIFPWFNEGEPVLWHSPDPRFILYPDDVKISRSMRQIISRNIFEFRFDCAFDEVIKNCARCRPEGTWITDSMVDAYIALNRLGYAHSAEAWHEGILVGGLYGIIIGKAFFGESMFSFFSNSSKFTLIMLSKKLSDAGFLFIDSQVHTNHVESMGGIHISRKEYLLLLKTALA